jgi:hypothetical protein
MRQAAREGHADSNGHLTAQTQKGIIVELIIMLLAPFPIGYLIRNRIAAFLAYVALHSFAFTFQSTTLLKAWAGGDHSAFVKNPATPDWAYALVNLAIYAAGLALVAAGSWVRARRHRTAQPAVDLAR